MSQVTRLFIPTCPRCKSHEIGYVVQVHISRPVDRVSYDTLQRLQPLGFDTSVIVDTSDALDVDQPWKCLACDTELCEEDLVLTPTSKSTAPQLAEDVAALIECAGNEAETLAELARDDPQAGRDATKALNVMARMRPLLSRLPMILSTLDRAESFIAGFEDDETQDGIRDLLSDIRVARSVPNY